MITFVDIPSMKKGKLGKSRPIWPLRLLQLLRSKSGAGPQDNFLSSKAVPVYSKSRRMG